IGEGKGQNWWCVLFPPLCFVDSTHAKLPKQSKEILERSLTADEVDLMNSDKDGEVPVKIKFKIVEMWQNSKMKMQTAFLNK
ncbi:MAG: stage II sporulation protein R, partial [Hyphomonadaceae bacterium]|nr:stage II sporulation protein R [Clostridia bacterium]